MFFERYPLYFILRLVAFQSANYSKKTVEEHLGFPSKPKRPLSPFFRFMLDSRPKVLAEFPKSSVTEIVQVIGKKWKEMDEKTKSKFAAEFAKEREAYEKVKAQYEGSLTQEQKEEIADFRRNLTEKIAEKREKAALKKVESSEF